DECLGRLSQVGTTGGGSVVTVAGGRWAGMEIFIGGEVLGQQFGTYYLAVFENQASVGLVGEDHGGDAGDEERIAQAQQDGGHDGEENRSLPDGMHGGSPCKNQIGCPTLAAPLFLRLGWELGQ